MLPTLPRRLSLTGDGVDFTLNPNGGTSLTITSGQNAVFPLLLSSPRTFPARRAFHLFWCSCQRYLHGHSLHCHAWRDHHGFGDRSYGCHCDLFKWAITFEAIWDHLAGNIAAAWAVLHCERIDVALFSWCSCAGLSRRLRQDAVWGERFRWRAGRIRIPTPIPVTPAGTYTIVATATSAGLTRTVNLTLIVQ